jgi:hypothetical protein
VLIKGKKNYKKIEFNGPPESFKDLEKLIETVLDERE